MKWIPYIMMVIEEFLQSRRQFAVSKPEMDPLREADALQEVQLLDVRVWSLTSTVGMLFELRTALQFKEGNAALLVVRGLREFQWGAARGPWVLSSLTVVSSRPTAEDDLFVLRLGFFPDAVSNIRGCSGEFYVVKVPDIGEAPPDYSDGDEKRVRGLLPNWTSPCSLLQASNRLLS